MNNSLPYVLLTAARNEASHLRRLLISVTSQTVKPIRWVIISDASSDGTDELVSEFSSQYSWIELIRMSEATPRDFRAKALCIKQGFQSVAELEFDVIGNLDADVSFATDYFEFLIGKFAASPNLGVAGTSYLEGAFCSTRSRFADLTHVPGQCQLFRRRCFESIGAYLPVKEGGIDTIAVTMAKVGGWHTRTFVEKSFLHHRRMGTWAGNSLRTAFRAGERDCLLGNHLLWQTARSFLMATQKPFLLGAVLNWLGYTLCAMRLRKKNMPAKGVELRQREQLQRLAVICRYLLRKKLFY